MLLLGFVYFFTLPRYSAAMDMADRERGKAVYKRYCVGCHGMNGDGRGIYRADLNPQPRDFTKGVFKWTGGSAGSLPSDDDLLITISEGVYGTTMPRWSALRESDRRYVIQYIKTFSGRFLSI